MELYLIRHGIAVERGVYAQDCDRPLTDRGRHRTHRVAQRLDQLGLHFDLILTSPFLRASQTAEILYETELGDTLESSALLEPDCAIQPWLSWLASWPGRQGGSLALVGHEPNWSHWTEQLISGEPWGRICVKKAGVVGLVLPEQASPLGNSELFWLTPPRLLL